MVKMKRLKRIYLVLFLACLINFMLPNEVYAAEINRNGIIVETNFDRNEYAKEDEVIYSVYLKNTNSEMIYVKDIGIDIPQGFVLDRKNKDYSLNKLNPGEDILLKYYLNVENQNNEPEPDKGDTGLNENSNPNINSENQNKDEINNDKQNNNEQNNDKQHNDTKRPITTGDTTNVLVWGTVIIISGIIFIIILKNKQCSKKMFSMMLVGTILFECAIEPGTVQAKNNENEIRITDKFHFNQIEQEIIFNMIVEKENKVSTDTTFYSRAEWIDKIIKTYGLNVDLSKATDTNFIDIDNTEYKDAIRIAEIYGIVDRNAKFNPNEIATREFATVSAVRLLALQGNGTPKCKDVSDITYQSEVYLGLKAGLVLLEDGKFNPQKAINNTSGKIILNKIKEFGKKPLINENKKECDYKKGVIQLDSSFVINQDEEYIILKKSNTTDLLKIGSVFVINDYETYSVKEVYVENECIKIKYSKPKLEEVLDKIYVSEHYNELDLNKIKLADGVSIVNNSSKIMPQSYRQDSEAGNNIEDQLSEEVTFEKKIGNAKFTIEIPEIEVDVLYDFDNSAYRIKEAYFGIKCSPQVKIEPTKKEVHSDNSQGENQNNNQGQDQNNNQGQDQNNNQGQNQNNNQGQNQNNNQGQNQNNNQEQNQNNTQGENQNNNQEENIIDMSRGINFHDAMDFVDHYLDNDYPGIKLEKTFELLEYNLAPGLTLNLDFHLEGSGTARLEWTLATAGGVKIINNVASYHFNADIDFMLIGELEALAGLKASLDVEVLDIPSFLALGIEPGLNIKASASPHITQPIFCTDFGYHLSLKIGMLDCLVATVCEFLNIKVPVWDPFDYKNSPLKKEFHYEIGENGGEYVDECSHKKYLANMHGYIKDNDDVQQLISNAKIEIFEKNETDFSSKNVLYSTTSNKKGKYSLNLDHGTYLVRISADKYLLRTETIIVAPGKQERDFLLKKDLEKGVCKIGNIEYPSISVALEDAKSGDTIVVFKNSEEPKSLVIPKNKEITILSEEAVDIKKIETATSNMIVNNGTLKLMGPMTFSFSGLTLLDNYSIMDISGGVRFVNQLHTGVVIDNKGEMSISNSYGNGNIENECVVKGCGNRLNTGIWNAGILKSNDRPFLVEDVQYGIVFEKKSIHDIGNNYRYKNVEIPQYIY